ncbi:hypothetical protein [Sphingomonas sp. CFBP 13706]|uniref:hypothetical protein n=1 Tax=Sphingomonas sp. CFBP 13706 TaxID=2775314 RepID=UPI00177B2CFB|nr:hypothetical protein [Sphingomonas sp. CFBP 13706]MBD8736228.1 hypothetical protein [Sphingomonas sp. CFBP 13706]
MDRFVAEYFSGGTRRCLFVAAAGFDPRSRHVAQLLATTLGDRVEGVFIREERGRPDAGLVAAADANEARLQAIMPQSRVLAVPIFGDDEAPIGGLRIAKALSEFTIDNDVTDVVLDMSALSIGVGFPAARILLEACERSTTRSFHLMIASDPDLDDRISSEPGDRPIAVRGFAGSAQMSSVRPVAKMWVPQLAKGRGAALDAINSYVGECYKICPMVPFPAKDPRRADALLAEHQSRMVNEWFVDPRDLVYVSERNPLDTYRTLSTLTRRFNNTVAGIFEPQIFLSPIGSKVMAAGALMTAIEYDLTVQYLETVRYEYAPEAHTDAAPQIVHLLLSGPAYGGYPNAPTEKVQTTDPQDTAGSHVLDTILGIDDDRDMPVDRS